MHACVLILLRASADAASSLNTAELWIQSSCINAMVGKVVRTHGSTMEPLRPPVPLAMSYVAASCRTSRRQSGASSALRPFLNSFSALSWKVCHPLVSDSGATRHHCAGGARQSDADRKSFLTLNAFLWEFFAMAERYWTLILFFSGSSLNAGEGAEALLPVSTRNEVPARINDAYI